MNFKTIIVSSLALAIAGCASEKQAQVTEVDNKEVQTASVGKPSAPISMHYKVLTENPKVGDQVEIKVEFSSTAKSTISANMTAAKSLNWFNSEKSWQTSLNKSGQQSELPTLKVSADQKGVYYIHLMASVEVEGKTLYKPFTIPVNVGNGTVSLESPGEVVTDDKGQKVIIQSVDSDN